MGECGYHLRCLNFSKKCSECKRKHKNKEEDYFNDALNLDERKGQASEEK